MSENNTYNMNDGNQNLDPNKLYSYQCPNCGADMEVSPDQKSIVCEYCGKKLFFANNSTPNNPNAQPELRVQQEQVAAEIRRQEGLKAANTARRVFLTIFAVFWLVVVGCIAFAIINSDINSSTRTSRTTAAPTEMDPFAGIQISVKGTAPYAKLDHVKNPEIRGISFHADKTEGLSNGDVITITVDEMSGYAWTETTYTYTVSGLDTFVTAPDKIPEADMQTIHEFSLKKIQDDWLKNIDGDPSSYTLYVESYATYVNMTNDPTGFYKNDSSILAAYKVDFKLNGTTGTYYTYVEIPDAYLRVDGTLKASYDHANLVWHTFWISDLGVKSHNYENVSGYKTVLEMESAMEEDGYTLVK